MADYVKSSSIMVFPAANRTEDVNRARLLSEMALTSIVNKMIDYAGFVITEEVTNTDNPFDFNIMGYYFHLDKTLDMIEAAGDVSVNDSIYGIIKLTDIDGYTQLFGGDTPSDLSNQNSTMMYKGIKFSKTPEASAHGHLITPVAGFYQLKLLTKTGNNTWEIPTESKFRYTDSSVRIMHIDDGEII